MSLERTRLKLREAAFFLGKFAQTDDRILRQDQDEPSFYLSAFLSAGRSVGDYVVTEEGERYVEWFKKRKEGLKADESTLLRFFRKERQQTVHVRGARVTYETELVPMHEILPDLEPGGGMGAFSAPAGTPAPQVQKLSLRFAAYPDTPIPEIASKYIALMARLLDEYEGEHPSARAGHDT